MLYIAHQFSSVQFSRSVVSDSLWPHEPQHVRPPCPSATPGVHPNPRPLSWWCHPTISSSAVQGMLQARILERVAFPFSRGIFPTQGSNPRLWHCRWILYQLSRKGSPLYTNLQRRWMCVCAHVQVWKLAHMSARHWPVCASFTGDRALVCFTSQ